MIKVSIIGAGNVGATTARVLSNNWNIDKIVLLDIKEGVAEAKAMDIMQGTYSTRSEVEVVGVTNNYQETADSDIIIITSGIPRKPGMTREELVEVNAKVVTSVLDQVSPLSPEAIYIMVSNPLDTMTYLAVKHLNISPNRVIGMGGLLDSSRFCYYLAKKANVSMNAINDCFVVGGHGDTTMVPLVSQVTISGEPATEVLSKEDLDEVVTNTMKGGATITNLMGTSAYVAPAECIAEIVSYILNKDSLPIACSIYNPEFDLCIGQVCRIGSNGVSSVIEMAISEDELEKFIKSVEAVKKVNIAL